MSYLNLMIALAATAQVDGSPVDAARFGRLIAGLHADIRDVSFAYEGRMRGVPAERSAEEVTRDDDPFAKGDFYQGIYSFRFDGAVLQDWFVIDTNLDPPREWHHTSALLHGELARVSRLPQRRNEQPQVRPGMAAELIYTPQRIYYGWFFQLVKDDPAAWNYEYLGWEDEGGHRCLKVQLDSWQGRPPTPGRPCLRFWIDMNRGGHPLRVDYDDGDGVGMRAVGIQLARLPLDGEEEVWFPARGRTEIAASAGGKPSAKPVAVETYYVLDNTVRFNQGLPDSYFTVEPKNLPETPELAKRRKEFRKPPPRFDPDGIREGLDQQLALADAQSKQLEASSPARGMTGWTPVWKYGLIGFGILLIAAALVARIKAQ